MKIVDCFSFFDEFLLLDIRFKELYDIVDHFVIVESEQTFTGNNKPLFLSNAVKQRYPQYLDKIHILYAPKIDTGDGYDAAWTREFFQKDILCKESLAFLMLSDEDIILLSDVDEIPRRSIIRAIKDCGAFLPYGGFSGPLYYFKFNIKSPDIWDQARWTKYGYFTKMTDHRYAKPRYLIPNSMWHFSSIKSPEQIKQKIEAYSHQEFNTEQINSIENIEKSIELAKDMFGRPGVEFKKVLIDESYPEYIKEHKEELSQWIAKLS